MPLTGIQFRKWMRIPVVLSVFLGRISASFILNRSLDTLSCNIYIDTEEGTCVACGPNCGSCDYRPDHCTSCEHHLVLHDNQCYANCPVNTYETNDYRWVNYV